MIVVLDTTVFFENAMAEGLNFALLRDFQFNENARVLVPRIVWQESINHFRRNLQDALGRAKKAFENLNGRTMQKDVWKFPTIDVEQETRKYEETLTLRLQRLAFVVANYDFVTLPQLVERALARRRPFDGEGGRGFRDAIIWEMIMKIAKEDDRPIVLITENTRDFGDDKKLASDLVEDLTKAGLSADKVTISQNLDAFNKKYVQPRLAKLDNIRVAIEEERYDKFNVEEFFTGYHSLFAEEAESSMEMDVWPGFPLLRNFRLAELSEAFSFKVEAVYRINDTQIVISLWYFFDGIVTCDRFRRLDSTNLIEDGTFSGTVHFNTPITVSIDETTGDVLNYDCNTFGWEFGSEWPREDR